MSQIITTHGNNISPYMFSTTLENDVPCDTLALIKGSASPRFNLKVMLSNSLTVSKLSHWATLFRLQLPSLKWYTFSSPYWRSLKERNEDKRKHVMNECFGCPSRSTFTVLGKVTQGIRNVGSLHLFPSMGYLSHLKSFKPPIWCSNWKVFIGQLISRMGQDKLARVWPTVLS